MEFKGTKGKWIVKNLDDIFIENEFGEQICEMPAKGIIRYETWQENALLISKAPEMLELIKAFCNAIPNDGTWNYQSCMEKANQLIKEATEL